MELQFLWHFCPSKQAYALVHKCHSLPLCGGLSIQNKIGFSNGKETMSNFSHRSRMGVIHSASFKSRASETFPEPLQVLSSTEALANYSVADSLEEGLCASTLPDLSESIYRVALTTSNNVDSSFREINTGILLCMIGENGNSIIHRIPAISSAQDLSEDTAKTVQRTFDHLRFQRGSVDIVTFRGPDIGQLAAVWIGPESGRGENEELLFQRKRQGQDNCYPFDGKPSANKAKQIKANRPWKGGEDTSSAQEKRDD